MEGLRYKPTFTDLESWIWVGHQLNAEKPGAATAIALASSTAEGVMKIFLSASMLARFLV